LPKRLSYPRVYVEQINPKFGTQTINGLTNYEVFLKKVSVVIYLEVISINFSNVQKICQTNSS